METILQNVPVRQKVAIAFSPTGTLCRMVSIRCFTQKRWRLACGTRLPENTEGAIVFERSIVWKPSCKTFPSARRSASPSRAAWTPALPCDADLLADGNVLQEGFHTMLLSKTM